MTTELAARPAPDALPIADVATELGVSAHTLRYYERIGLLRVGRDDAGRRRYTEHDLARIRFIARLRLTDMPIRTIQTYFALAAAGPATETQRLELLTRHRDAVRERLAALEVALAAVDHKIDCYGGSGQP